MTRGGLIWVAPAVCALFIACSTVSQQGMAVVAAEGTYYSVGISADGSTVAVGEPGAGRVRVFARSGKDWKPIVELSAGDGSSGSRFGASIAVSEEGDTIVVGAPDAEVAGKVKAGKIFVFVRPPEGWPSGVVDQPAWRGESIDVQAGARFGESVSTALHGARIAIGAPGQSEERGSVYLYENRDWTAKIAATRINQLGYAGVAPGDRFGAAVAMSLDGANVAAGAPGRRGTRGSVYLFREPEKGWNDNSNIMMIPIEPDAAAGDQFGTSVALSKYGDRLLVGAPALTARSFLLLLEIDWAAKNVVPRTVTLGPPKDLVALGGSVALSSDAGVIAASARSVRTAEGVVAYYRDDTRKWAKDYKVNSLSGPAEPYGAFGASVALSADGTSLVASVPREAGAVDGFLTRQVDRDAERAAEAALYAVDVRELGYATAISLDGKTAVVGAPAGDTDVADAGYVFLYEKTDTGWKVQAELTAGDGRASGDRFGEVVSVSSDGSTVAVGAPAASSPGIKAHGAVFIFTRPADGWPAKVIGPTARLQFNSPDTGDRMGHAVAVSGDGSIVVVGAPSRRNGQGAAVYYVRPAGGWSADTGESQRSLLFSSLELADGDRYGYSVAVAADASVVVVGAPGKKSTGEVVMVERPKEGWTEPKAFTVSTVPWEGYDLNGRKRFGKSLAVVPDGSAVLFGLDSADPAVGAVGKIMRKKNPDGKLTLSISYFENEIDAPFEMEDYGHALAVSAEGSVIAVGSLGKGNAGQLSILKFDTGDLSGRFRVYRKSFEGAVRYGTSVAVAPDGSIVRCGVPHYNGGAGAQDFLSVAEIFQ